MENWKLLLGKSIFGETKRSLGIVRDPDSILYAHWHIEDPHVCVYFILFFLIYFFAVVPKGIHFYKGCDDHFSVSR